MSAKKETKRSKYIGVVWHKHACLWMARIKVSGIEHYLLYTHNEEEAAKAYDDAVFNFGVQDTKKHLNFPHNKAA